MLLSVPLAIGALMTAMPFCRYEPWASQPVLTLLSAIVVLLAITGAAAKWLRLPKMHDPSATEPPDGLRVAAVTTYVPGEEPLEMAECTLRSLQRMDYPHDCWLLDEGDDPAARRLCERLGVSYFTRAGRPCYQAADGEFESASKHGNYNAWLADCGYSRYDVVVSFDLDHVPDRNFLTATLGHLRDPAVGYVQAPQAYYNQRASFVAAGAAEETYDFYSTAQRANFAAGHPMVVGCHNVHRIAALRDVGGYAAHSADDVLLTMLYHQHGWKGVYVPRILARGLTPVDWESYLVQQRRWARSICDLKFHHLGRTAAGMPLVSRWIKYLTGLSYLQPAVIFVTLGILLMVSLADASPPMALESITLWAWLTLAVGTTSCYLYRQQFFLDPRDEFGLHFRARIVRMAKAPALLLGLLDALTSRRFGYVITSKSGLHRVGKPVARIFGACGFALAAAWWLGVRTHPIYPASLHWLAMIAVTACLMLAATDFTRFPRPFDRSLLVKEWAPWLA